MRLPLFVLAFLALATPAFAPQAFAIVAPPPVQKANGFTCDPPEFTLVRTDKGLHLHATLEVPTQWHISPGIGHGIDQEGLRHGGEFLARHLNARK